MQKDSVSRLRTLTTPIESDKEYDIIIQSNTVVVELADELFKLHRFTKDIYKKNFQIWKQS